MPLFRSKFAGALFAVLCALGLSQTVFVAPVQATVSTETRKAGPYAGNGVTTSFAFAFKVFSTSDVIVTTATSAGVETTRTLDVDYSVSLNADQDASPGGTVTYPISGTALASGSTLTIDSDVADTQGVDLVTGGAFLPSVIENGLDRGVILSQQLRRDLVRSVKQPKSDSAAIGELPTAANRASKYLGFDTSGNPVASAGTATATTAAMTGITDAGALYNSANVETALAEIGTAARSFGTLTLLKAATARYDGELVTTFCYYTCTTPDGGGASYRYDAASSSSGNDCTIVDPDAVGNGRWELVHNGQIDVRQCGASTARTAAQNATAIDAAIVALPANSTLYINEIYTTTGQDISGKSDVKITGTGGLTLSGAASGAYIFELIGTVSRLTIEGLKLRGDNNAAYTQSAIGNASGQTVSDVRFGNNHIDQINVGISLNADLGGTYDSAWVYNNKFKDIVGTSSGQGYGIHLSNATNVHIYDNEIDNASRHSIYHARGGRGNKIHGNTIRNHRKDVFNGGFFSALAISRSNEVTAYGNTFIDCYDAQTEVSPETSGTANASNIKVHGNLYYNRKNAVPAILVGEQAVPTSYFADGVEIHDNTFVEAHGSVGTTGAIRVLNGTEISIRRNRFLMTGVSSTARFIELGNASYISASGHFTNSYTSDNEFIAEGSSLVDVRAVTMDADICTGTSSHDIRRNSYQGVSDKIVYGAARTNTNIVHITDNAVSAGIYAAGDTTPSVKGVNYLEITNAGATSITNFDDGELGQILVLRFRDGNTTITNNMYLAGGINYNPGANDTVTLVNRSGNWEELARSNN